MSVGAELLAAINARDVAALTRAYRSNAAYRDEDGRTPLVIAAEDGFLAGVRACIDAGGQPRDVDMGGRTAFLAAAGAGHQPVVEFLLSLDKAQLTAKTKSGNTALHRAAVYGHGALVEFLLAAGAAKDATNSEGATPLSRASRWGHDSVVAALLEHHADPSVTDRGGLRPLDWALRKQHDGAAALLQRAAASAAAAGSHHTHSLSISPAAAPALHPRAHAAHRPTAAAVVTAAAAEDDDGDADIGEEEEEEGEAEEGGDAFEEGCEYEEGAGGAGGGEYDGEDECAPQYLVDEDGYDLRTSSDVDALGLGGEYDGEEEELYDLGAPIRVEGWMAKQGHVFKTWKNRWFVLEGRAMLYFAREGATKAKGMINMAEGTDVMIEEKYAKPFCFTIATPTKRYILQAANEDEMAEWIEAIQNNLECCVADDEAMAAAGMEDDD